jgi:uncharacterized protein
LPTSDPDDRLVSLDILRGLALISMILVHFHQRMRIEVSGLEDLIGWFVWIFVEQKAWGVFALLFGAGFAILLRRLDARGEPALPVFARRLLSLAAFGVIAEICFGFSILLEYACLGVPLFLIRRWSTRALFVTAAIGACAAPLAAELSAWWAFWHHASQPPPVRAVLEAAVSAAADQRSYAALLSARWAQFVGLLPTAAPAPAELEPHAVSSWGCSPSGIGCSTNRCGTRGRSPRGWFSARHRGPWAGWSLKAAGGRGSRRDLADPVRVRSRAGSVAVLHLCGAVILLLAWRPAWIARLKPAGQAGRMALTNYMLQAAVIDFLSSGYGLGLELRPLAYAAGAALLSAIQCALSSLWLAHFRFGPLEWIWRTLTYARVSPSFQLDDQDVRVGRPDIFPDCDCAAPQTTSPGPNSRTPSRPSPIHHAALRGAERAQDVVGMVVR